MMTLTRTRIHLHGSGNYPAWKWIYNLDGIPDPLFGCPTGPNPLHGSSSGSKPDMLALAKKYGGEFEDMTKAKEDR
jgi:hypothetical protein